MPERLQPDEKSVRSKNSYELLEEYIHTVSDDALEAYKAAISPADLIPTLRRDIAMFTEHLAPVEVFAQRKYETPYGEFIVYPTKYLVKSPFLDTQSSLTPVQFSLLTSLLSAPGHVIPKESLIQKLGDQDGKEYITDNNLAVHILRLRHSVGDQWENVLSNQVNYKLIQTYHSVGYRFAEGTRRK